MKTWIRCSICALGLALGSFVAGARPAASWSEEWLARFNQERTEEGVRPLLPSPVLDQVAQAQAEEMARRGWGLQPFPAAAVAERLRQVGYSAHDWRESYLLSYRDPESALDSREAKCREVRDGHFRDLGVGVASSEGATFYVFLFGWHQGDFFAGATARLTNRARVASEMLAKVNEARRRERVPPLASNPLLDRISQEHAEDMLTRSYFGHRTPEGLGPSERARADGYRAGIGENIVEQRFSTQEALEAWLGSPGHRRNILDPTSREMGLGLAVGAGYDAAPGGYRVIWVQSFGRGN
ncbi:MAG TPA: CAP domain-containing protein [Thermoanaerobaculia bacterium]